MMDNPEGFEIWMRQLRALIAEKCPGYSEDDDAWRQFYNDACSPEAALAAALSRDSGEAVKRARIVRDNSAWYNMQGMLDALAADVLALSADLSAAKAEWDALEAERIVHLTDLNDYDAVLAFLGVEDDPMTPPILAIERIIERAEVAEAEALRMRTILFPEPTPIDGSPGHFSSADALDNLDGAITDIEYTRQCDAVSLKTIKRVADQLQQAREALRLSSTVR